MGELNIGSLGRPADDLAGPAERDTFHWFGKSVRVGDKATDLALIDFMEAAGELDEKDPRSLLAMKNFVRGLVFADDFEEFWTLAHQHRQGFKELAELAFTLIEQVTDRPTDQSSDSSVGLSATAPSSTAASYSQVRSKLAAEGRPDLALVYEQAETAGVARQAV